MVVPIQDTAPTRRFPVVTLALIGTNISIWLVYQLPSRGRSVAELGFYPCEIDGSCSGHGQPWPVNAIAAMFLHGSWVHIVGNMLFLWVFGDNVEEAMGRARFLVFYVLSGLTATAAQTYVTLTLGSPGQVEIPMVGASGAIAGVLGAYVVLFPLARVLALVPLPLPIPVELPALFLIGVWFLLQLWQAGFSLLAPAATGGVAFFAHVGGFVFGLLAAGVFASRHRSPMSKY